jgi:hypothetical protein
VVAALWAGDVVALSSQRRGAMRWLPPWGPMALCSHEPRTYVE